MIELTTKVIAVTLESTFLQTRPFSKEWLDRVALKALEVFKGSGLQPEDVKLRTMDVLFGYELNISLFGGSATFQLTGARLVLNFRNILNAGALKTAAGSAIKAHSIFENADFAEHALAVAAHFGFHDQQQQKDYASSTADPVRQIEFLGQLAYFRLPEWGHAIRLQIDRSVFFPPGLFVSWNSSWRGEVDEKTLTQIATVYANTASRFGFHIILP